MANKYNSATLQEQLDAILQRASESGLENNYFMVTTLSRYQQQLKLIKRLAEQLEQDGYTVSKEYVKGRLNVCAHPCVAAYNQACTSANNTVQTLLKILKSLDDEAQNGGAHLTHDDDTNKLVSFLKGRGLSG